jgi:hypothetical protein
VDNADFPDLKETGEDFQLAGIERILDGRDLVQIEDDEG